MGRRVSWVFWTSFRCVSVQFRGKDSCKTGETLHPPLVWVGVQVFVESLDRAFENVCELDLVFHFDEVRPPDN